MTTARSKYGADLDVPGPGSYGPGIDQRGSGFLGDAPMYSMGARKAVPKPDDASPGPVYSPRVITPGASGPIGDAAQYSFGSSKRWESMPMKEPGPGQYAQNSTRVGGTMLGDAAKYSFGTSSQRPMGDLAKGQRFISKEHALKSNYATQSPGPLKYNVTTELGSQLVASGAGGPNSPRYTMRPRLEGQTAMSASPRDQPGPATYNQATAFGQQVSSARNTGANYSFGTSERHRPETHPKKTVYIGKDFEKALYGTISPGPSRYDAKSTVGVAPPNYKQSSSFSFNRESRFAY